MSNHDDRLARLPKWARAEIAALHRKVHDMKRELVAKRGDETRVQVDPHSGLINDTDRGPRLYLSDHDTVRFQLGDSWQDHIDVHLIKNHNGVHGVLVRGGNVCLKVLPSSANHVDIYLEK